MAIDVNRQFQLMTDSSFNFRQLAMEEMKKYSKRFMMKGASSLVHGITKDSFTHFGKVRISEDICDMNGKWISLLANSYYLYVHRSGWNTRSAAGFAVALVSDGFLCGG